jgi:hypothetical protein
LRVVGLRAAALTAAVVLALLSRGDVIVLAVLLAVGAWRPLPAAAVVSALAAAAWRWSSTALEDIAGAQAVLGPAGVVDPPTSATAAWLGAVAIVLATPNLVEAWLFERAHAGALSTSPPRWLPRWLEWLPPLAAGASAAVVVAGPAPGGDVWARLVAGLVAIGLARLVAGRRRVLDRHLLLDGAAAVLGLGSLVAVAVDAPPLDDILDAEALLEGAVLAVAVGLLAGIAGALVAQRPPRGSDREGRVPEGAR